MKTQPQPSQSQGTAEDRRRSPRRDLISKAWISSPTAKPPVERIEVSTVDLSEHGVAFESKTPVALHAFYLMEMELEGSKMLQEIHTIRCRKTETGAYRVGADFN